MTVPNVRGRGCSPPGGPRRSTGSLIGQGETAMLRTPRVAGPRAALLAIVAAALAVTTLQAPGQAVTNSPATPAYKNSKLPVQDRVADLLSRMTLAEKIGQMTQAERIDVDANPSLITTNLFGSIL